MIVWRGLGIVALLPILAIPLLALPLRAVFGLSDDALPLVVGIAVAACSIPSWFLADWLNTKRPTRKLDEWYAMRKTQLDGFVAQGTFNLGPGNPVPRTPEEAKVQAAALLAAERQQLAARLPNVHTLFFVPAQYMVILIGVAFSVIAVVGLFTLLAG